MLDPTYRAPEPEPRPEPIFNIPAAILAVMLALVALHALRQILPEAWDETILQRLAFEPATVTYVLDPARVLRALQAQAAQGDAALDQARFGRAMLETYGFQPWTLLSYGLLHASWAHVGLNLLWLLAFGAPVARRLRTARLLLFLCGGTLAGALAHTLTHPVDMMPIIGASAAVSACMGAALRFVFQPQATASASPEDRGDALFRRPLLPLSGILRDRRAASFLIAWFATNLLFGIGSLSTALAGGPVAWQAHIGGFLFGLLALPLFEPRDLETARLPEQGD